VDDYGETDMMTADKATSTMDDYYGADEEGFSSSETTRKEIWTMDSDEAADDDWDDDVEDKTLPAARGQQQRAEVTFEQRPRTEGAKQSAHEQPAQSTKQLQTGGGGGGSTGSKGRVKSSPGQATREQSSKKSLGEIGENGENGMYKSKQSSEEKTRTLVANSGTNTKTTSDIVVVDPVVIANHRLEAVELTEYSKRRRGEPNKVRVETTSVSTVTPSPPSTTPVPMTSSSRAAASLTH
jgi:hypothetical protein